MDHLPHFKIVVLEDNDFYNKLITNHIKNYINNIALIKGFTFEISSFTSFKDCILNFSDDTNIIISDYYLNDGYNAMHLLEHIRNKNSNCQIVILSQTQSIKTAISTLLEGACEFIHKDKKALANSGLVVEEIIAQQLKNKLGSSSHN